MGSPLVDRSGTHPVLAELRARATGAARTGRLALVVEGGTKRGAYSAGMLVALEQLGYGPGLFDAIYAASAGALNAAYFISGQLPAGIRVYYEDLHGREFVDPFRPLRERKRILSLDYVFDVALGERQPLEASAVIEAAKLRPVATDVDLAEAVAFEPADDPSNLIAQLRASCTLPFLAGAPFEIGGRRYLDASLTEPIPFERAQIDGSTHVLVLSTRPLGVGQDAPRAVELAIAANMSRVNPRFGPLIRRRNAISATRAAVLAAANSQFRRTPAMYTIAPDPAVFGVDDSEVAAACGYRAVLAAFGLADVTEFTFTPVFEPARVRPSLT